MKVLLMQNFQTAATVLTHRLPHSAKPRARILPQRGITMKLHFTKMQGAGNDYIYINAFRETVPEEERPALIRRLSDRHFGIGGDGVIFIAPGHTPLDCDVENGQRKGDCCQFEMQMYNLDGSRGEMCGNGIRCVGKYVYDHDMIPGIERSRDPEKPVTITVESAGAVKILILYPHHGRVERVRVDMGAPILEPGLIPVKGTQPEGKDPLVGYLLAVLGKTYHVTPVSMGNPHCVVFSEELNLPEDDRAALRKNDGAELPEDDRTALRKNDGAEMPENDSPNLPENGGSNLPEDGIGTLPENDDTNQRGTARRTCGGADGLDLDGPLGRWDMTRIGPAFERHPFFPNRTNTEFVHVIDRRHVEMRVYERGSGETLACGTGCCAVCVACVLNGRTDRTVEVTVLGGRLLIEWDEKTGHVFMTGPAAEVFEGIVETDCGIK